MFKWLDLVQTPQLLCIHLCSGHVMPSSPPSPLALAFVAPSLPEYFLSLVEGRTDTDVTAMAERSLLRLAFVLFCILVLTISGDITLSIFTLCPLFEGTGRVKSFS